MKMLIVMLACLLATSSGFAADPPAGKETPKKPEAADVQKSGAQKPGKDQKPSEWPRPYKPTEEISADSVVPFPADI